MPAPSFIHLRLHSEYSIVDGIVRIEEAVEAAAKEGMPALALTDLANVFGMVKFYKAAREAGLKPIIGCDVWLENESDRDKPYRLLLLAQSRAGYLRLCDLLTRAYRSNQYRGRSELKKGWFAESGTEGLIALSGAHHGDVGQALAADNVESARRLARRVAGALSRTATTSSCSGPGRTPRWSAPRRYRWRPTCSARCGSPRRSSCPSSRRTRCSSCSRDDFRAHEARVCIAEGYVLSDQRRPRRFSAGAVFQDAGRDGGAVQGPAAGARQQRGNREALQPGARARQDPAAAVSHAQQRRARRVPARVGRRGTGAAPARSSIPTTKARAEREARYRERLAFELETIVQMGFPGYFLIVADFINWAKGNGVPVGPGRGSGAGLARRLQPRHHRPRSAALRPAVRALPQSRARVDAGLRHRFLPGRARPRHRVREAEVRRRQRVADRDLRHHGGEGGGARRRPRARPVLHVLRPAREADPVPAGQAHHARRRARDGAAARRSARRRRRRCASCSRSRKSSRASRATSACTRAAC